MKGSELKKMRNELGLSVAKAARQVEVHPRTWARWESDQISIPEGALKLFKIVNGLERVKR